MAYIIRPSPPIRFQGRKNNQIYPAKASKAPTPAQHSSTHAEHAQQKAPKGAASSDSTQIADPRFSNFSTDARFRLPSKKSTRTILDKRFSALLKDEDVIGGAKVDRYGRKLEIGAKKKALEQLYAEDSEVDDDEAVQKELETAKAYDPARGGGFSSSEDESDDEEDGGAEIAEPEFPDLQTEQTELEMGEVTSRIAVVNMDWDHIRAIDLMAVFQSFVPSGGQILKISVYQSDFGSERLAREEAEGPAFGDVVDKSEEEDNEPSMASSEDDSDDEEEIKKQLQKPNDGQEVDSTKLRQYQLDRLRYYYAVMECSDKETAQQIYDSTDGSEYLSSANFFDLRFIPEETEFDNVLRDSCTDIPEGYRPNEFITDALQHSKVKLTWDMDPEETTRKDAINRAFTGSRADIAANDLAAYVGNDSSDSEKDSTIEEGPKKSKKELERDRIRAALGLTDEAAAKKHAGPVGDLEITFTPGLTAQENGGIFENEPIKDETTAERYIRKEKERKARRREKARAAREEHGSDAALEAEPAPREKEQLGFDDPFFGDEETKAKASKASRKEERQKSRDARRQKAQIAASDKAELELLMEDNATSENNQSHFDISEIARAEKRSGKKGRKGKIQQSSRGGLQEDFEIDVNDPRFAAVYESHEFAIDRSHPRFQETKAMKKVLDEGRKRRNVEDSEEPAGAGKKKLKSR